MKKLELRKIIKEEAQNLLSLLEADSASEEAKKRGLVHKGWGRYADPSTGKIVAKNEKGKLVSVNVTNI